MSAEAWTVIAVGISILTLGFKIDAHVREQGQRLARLEGLLEGLRDSITGSTRA